MWMEAYRAPGKDVSRSHHRSFDSTHPNLVAAFTQNASMERRMSPSAQHHAINYIEFTTTDIAATKAFYEKAFSWNFQDYGPDYIAFDKDHAGIDGGFRKGDPTQSQSDTAPLIVLYSQDLKATQDAIIAVGGSIVVPTFDFPGGKRFHFTDGQGNVLAVWSE
jgi:predicted enzyme related to lactoylglutathione lyase